MCSEYAREPLGPKESQEHMYGKQQVSNTAAEGVSRRDRTGYTITTVFLQGLFQCLHGEFLI